MTDHTTSVLLEEQSRIRTRAVEAADSVVSQFTAIQKAIENAKDPKAREAYLAVFSKEAATTVPTDAKEGWVLLGFVNSEKGGIITISTPSLAPLSDAASKEIGSSREVPLAAFKPNDKLRSLGRLNARKDAPSAGKGFSEKTFGIYEGDEVTILEGAPPPYGGMAFVRVRRDKVAAK